MFENVAWNALAGAQARFAAGGGGALRYHPGFAAIAAFAQPDAPDFRALAAVSSPGEQLFCTDLNSPLPEGWRVDFETPLQRMVWRGPLPEGECPEAVQLGAAHAAAALDLATLTRPGPFGPRTLELGDYFGVFEAGRLIAMAGERMHAGVLREVSGICTHPDFQCRGLARRLTLHLVRRQMLRGETPFLHVVDSNANALRLYRSLGFQSAQEALLRVIVAP